MNYNRRIVRQDGNYRAEELTASEGTLRTKMQLDIVDSSLTGITFIVLLGGEEVIPGCVVWCGYSFVIVELPDSRMAAAKEFLDAVAGRIREDFGIESPAPVEEDIVEPLNTHTNE